MARRRITEATVIRDTPLGRMLTAKRKALELSTHDVGKAVGISHTYVSNLEQGRNLLPSREVLVGLARVLGLDELELAAAAYQVTIPKYAPPGPFEGGVTPSEVERILEEINHMPTEADRLAAFQRLPPLIRRVIRQLGADLVVSANGGSEASA